MFHSISSFIYVFVLVLITVYVSSHSNAMLLISCHVIYIFLSLILCFMPANTLEVDTEKKLYVPKGTITVRDSDLYLYDPNGIYVIGPNGASISVNCMLQQLYPYRHAYLSNYPVISRKSVLFCSLNNL